ncbi:MAG: hypothetical protein NC300_11305 [Bacteroidales bacterium]|nr:hypothetical protein [Clostridium sp.]MCM1204718.1 hypothetical protein [Bacteroidales bacterium]
MEEYTKKELLKKGIRSVRSTLKLIDEAKPNGRYGVLEDLACGKARMLFSLDLISLDKLELLEKIIERRGKQK